MGNIADVDVGMDLFHCGGARGTQQVVEAVAGHGVPAFGRLEQRGAVRGDELIVTESSPSSSSVEQVMRWAAASGRSSMMRRHPFR